LNPVREPETGAVRGRKVSFVRKRGERWTAEEENDMRCVRGGRRWDARSELLENEERRRKSKTRLRHSAVSNCALRRQLPAFRAKGRERKRTELPIHCQRLTHLRRLFPSDAVQCQLNLAVLPDPFLDLLAGVRLAGEELVVGEDMVRSEGGEGGFEGVDVGTGGEKVRLVRKRWEGDEGTHRERTRLIVPTPHSFAS
jgi:hypothetical protein